MEFLTTPENDQLNQYWYSPRTIATLVAEVEAGALGDRIAFLSTPSVYFSLSPERRATSFVFDFDDNFATKSRNYRQYDFNVPDHPDFDGTFTGAIVDPPFVTSEVWRKYCAALRLALKPGARIVLTTIPENHAMLQGEVGPLVRAPFWPAMHGSSLPYQYVIFLNYQPDSSSPLNQPNPDVVAYEELIPNSKHDDRPITGTSLSFDDLLRRELERGASSATT